MSAISEFTAWGMESSEPAFIFKSPLLTLGTLNEFGIFPEMIDEHHAVLRYRRVDGPQGLQGEYDIRLLVTNGRLAGLIFPAKIREGLGRENIRRLFAMIGGSNGTGLGLIPVSKAQLISAELFTGQAEMLGGEVVIDLEPLDSRNRPIYVKMHGAGQTDYYSSFYINLKRRSRG